MYYQTNILNKDQLKEEIRNDKGRLPQLDFAGEYNDDQHAYIHHVDRDGDLVKTRYAYSYAGPKLSLVNDKVKKHDIVFEKNISTYHYYFTLKLDREETYEGENLDSVYESFKKISLPIEKQNNGLLFGTQQELSRIFSKFFEDEMLEFLESNTAQFFLVKHIIKEQIDKFNMLNLVPYIFNVDFVETIRLCDPINNKKQRVFDIKISVVNHNYKQLSSFLSTILPVENPFNKILHQVVSSFLERFSNHSYDLHDVEKYLTHIADPLNTRSA